MMFSATHKLESMHNWAAADYYFRTTYKRTSGSWRDNERPLGTDRAHHYRVVRNSDESYDLVLYQTPMVRYFKPTGGETVVWVHTDPRQTSTQFLYHVAGFGCRRQYWTTDGRYVTVGLNPDGGGEWPVKLVFVGNRLDASRSVDLPNRMPPVTSPARRAERAEFRKWLKTYVAMAAIVDVNVFPATSQVRQTVEALRRGAEVDPTPLLAAIKRGKNVVGMMYPTGDVVRYEESMKEQT